MFCICFFFILINYRLSVLLKVQLLLNKTLDLTFLIVFLDSNDKKLMYSILVYLSDLNLINTGLTAHQPPLVVNLATSLDHALWVHEYEYVMLCILKSLNLKLRFFN